MNTNVRLWLVGFLCLMSIDLTAVAQTEIAPVTRNGIEYVSGGVGEEEVQAIRALETRYNLRLTFALTGGEYLSDVTVALNSEKGVELVNATAHGPFLFFKVPPGRYKITAQADHVIEHRWVRVPEKGGVETRFYWPEPGRHGPVGSR